MTNFTLGRIGLDANIDDVSMWESNNETVTVAFSTPMVGEGGSVDRANAYRQMILGYAESPDQRFVAVTWAADPQADGYYRVRSASVSPDPDLALDGLYYYTATLERVQGYGMPAIQTTYVYRERTNVHDVTAVAYLGQPSAATVWGYAYEPEDGSYSNQSTSHTVSSSEGSVNTVTASATGGSGPLAGELALWTRNINPDGYYVGAARIEVGGFPIEGRQVPRNWQDNWRLTNGTTELTMDAAGISGGDAIFQMRGWNGITWTDPIPVSILGGETAATPRDPMSGPESLTILRNTAEEVTLRFVFRVTTGKKWPMFLDITCRRGIRTFTARLRRASGTGNGNPAISVPNHLTAYGWRAEGAWVSAGVLVETNYIWNTRALFDDSYFTRYLTNGTATGRITGVTGVGSTSITTAYRVTASSAHATTSFGCEHGLSGTTTPNASFVPATEYTFAIYVRCSVARSLNFRVQWRNSSGTLITTLDAGDTVVSANTWTRITVTGTSPAATARVSMHVRGNSAGAAWTAGDTMDITGLQAELGNTINAWWDGENGASDDLIYMYETNNYPNTASLKFDRNGEPTYWITTPIWTELDTDGIEPDPAIDADPVSWDFGFGMMSADINGDQGRYLREVQGYYMSINQTDDVVAV